MTSLCLQGYSFQNFFEVYVIELKWFSHFWEGFQNSYSAELYEQLLLKKDFLQAQVKESDSTAFGKILNIFL